MGSEVVQSAAVGAATPQIPACSVLVISRDSAERQALVLELGSCDQVEASSASGFHMAVPLLWSNPPQVMVIGALTPTDQRHLPDLRRHAPKSRVMLLASAGDVHGEAKPDVRVPQRADLLASLADLLTAEQ